MRIKPQMTQEMMEAPIDHVRATAALERMGIRSRMLTAINRYIKGYDMRYLPMILTIELLQEANA